MTAPPGIRLLTYNVKMLPGVAKLFERPLLRSGGFWEHPPHGFRDRKRALALARAVMRAEPEWDVICLQELFPELARQLLVRKLSPTYHCVGALGGYRLSRPGHSGLFLATRLPVLEQAFEPYRAAAGADRLCDKGIAHLVLDASSRWPDVPFLHVFATHMQAWPEHASARRLQLAQAGAFIQRRLAAARSDGRHAAVLCGDLNVIGEEGSPPRATEEYHLLRGLLGRARDLYRERHPNERGSTWDSTENPHMTGDPAGKWERLDYIWAFDDRDGQPLRALCCRSAAVLQLRHGRRHLSDHFALEAELAPTVSPVV